MKIGFIDFQGLREGRETALSFSALSIRPAFPRPVEAARYAASASGGRWKYTWSGVCAPRLECGRWLL